MKNFNNELKTGLVVVVAILIGVFFWFRTSNFKSDLYRIKTDFNHANGLSENAVVSLAGIEAGRVEKIDFVYKDGETKIELVLAIEDKAKVRTDSIAFIGTSGFVGDPYVGITPGTSKAFVEEGATIASEDPVEMREIMKRADAIAKNLDVVLGDVKTLVGDNKEKIDSIVTNLEATTVNFNDFSADIKAHPWKLLMKGKDKKKK